MNEKEAEDGHILSCSVVCIGMNSSGGKNVSIFIVEMGNLVSPGYPIMVNKSISQMSIGRLYFHLECKQNCKSHPLADLNKFLLPLDSQPSST